MPLSPLTQAQLLAAINALHDAEAARLPLSGRVNAVAAALGLVPAEPAVTVAEVLACRDRLAERLAQTPDDGDRALLADAHRLLQAWPGVDATPDAP